MMRKGKGKGKRKPKNKWGEFSQTKEYKLWLELSNILKDYNISGDYFVLQKDIGGAYWEFLLERIFKLGVTMKLSGKLKEIKMDWIRPLLYFESVSNEKLTYDGVLYIVNKVGITSASILRFSVQNFLNILLIGADLTEENYLEHLPSFKKEAKDFFSRLIHYIKEGGFRIMHENVKLILLPLRLMRKSGYRLFSLEMEEANNMDLTLFKSKKALKAFTSSIRSTIKWDQFKLKRDCDMDMFNEYLQQDTNYKRLEYIFTDMPRDFEEEKKELEFNPLSTQMFNSPNKKEEGEEVDRMEEELKKKPQPKPKALNLQEQKMIADIKTKHNLLNPNISNLTQPEPTRFRKEALQLKFEEGIAALIKYLNSKLTNDFPFEIDTHQLFVNLRSVPQGKENQQTRYYLEPLDAEVRRLKVVCYEMKLNGLSRVNIPITENKDLIALMKELFDSHVIVDNIMGDYLLHEQYMFFFQKIKFIKESTMKEDIEKLKNREFMESSIPRYVLFEALVSSAVVLQKMIDKAKLEEKPFDIESYYQVTHHELGSETNVYYYSYEVGKDFMRFYTDAIKETKAKYAEEVKEYGRFWLMEGFFPKEDKAMWIEAIQMLLNINELVREDIRDSLLMKHKENDAPMESKSRSRKNSIDKEAIIRKKSSNVKGFRQKSIHNKERAHYTRKATEMSSGDESFENPKKIPLVLDGLRPPNVWNFPMHKVEEIKNKRLLRELKDANQPQVLKTEIRTVDPTLCYRDKRVEKFMQLFNQIYLNYRAYCKANGNKWAYFFDKVLKVLEIHYSNFGFNRTITLKSSQNTTLAVPVVTGEIPKP